jgi:hypothetical protein
MSSAKEPIFGYSELLPSLILSNCQEIIVCVEASKSGDVSCSSSSTLRQRGIITASKSVVVRRSGVAESGRRYPSTGAEWAVTVGIIL